MINNRQNGRRRGRGGQQVRNGQAGAPERGNRIDNRARGNAAQLLEKYKSLARDAQMQGDRVNTEYYLQFADHYFRVLSENRLRFEEQRPQQRRDEYRDDFGGDEGEGEGQRGFEGARDPQGDGNWNDGEDERGPRPQAGRGQPYQPADPQPRDPQPRDQQSRDPRQREQPPRQEGRSAGDGRADGERRPRRAPRANAGPAGGEPAANGSGHEQRAYEPRGAAPDDRIAADVLPQGFAAPGAVQRSLDMGAPGPDAEEAPRPRRRAPRRPRGDAAGTEAPASEA